MSCSARGHVKFRRNLFRGAAGDGNWLRRRRLRSSRTSGLREAKWLGIALVIGVFQAIEALICDVDQLIGLISVLRKCGDAVVHGHGKSQLQRLKSFRKNCLDAPAEGQGLGRIGLRQKKGKLIPTDAEGGVRCAQCFLKCCRGSAQNFIAAGMTVFIVHFFEAMKVENDDAERKTIAASAVEFLLEGFGEQSTVVKASQRIGDSIDLKLLELVVFENDWNTDQSLRRKERPSERS